jgi:uncharacterized RDD family membrane protein YckC
MSEAVSFAVGIAWVIGFYVFFEYVFGLTPGKVLCKTRLVRDDGGRPTLGQVLIRTLCRAIPFEPFSVYSSDGRMWHDKLSRTRVVPREP